MWQLRFPSDMSFGGGDAAKRFIETIGHKWYWEMPLQKGFVD